MQLGLIPGEAMTTQTQIIVTPNGNEFHAMSCTCERCAAVKAAQAEAKK